MSIKPMLAANPKGVDLQTKLIFPMRIQPKLDGIRAIIYNGAAYSRSGKLIPNKFIQRWVQAHGNALNGLDGELIVGEPNTPGVYNRTSSGVMSFEGSPDFKFYVFDSWLTGTHAYHHRRSMLTAYLQELEECMLADKLVLVIETEVGSHEEADARFQELLEMGYEGAILRGLKAVYKHGRSTMKEGGLIKMKDFQDTEGVVIGSEELMRNGNEARTSELGFTVRSSHQENLTPGGCLGKLFVRCRPWKDFSIGTGFDQDTRDRLWRERDNLEGRIVKFKFMPSGSTVRPRHPVFLGFRDERDIS